jgi:hypothetical protein
MFAAGSKPSDTWNGPPSPDPPSAINYWVFLLSMNVIDLALDIIVLLIPLPIISALKMSTARKVQVMGVLALGAV